MQIDPNYKKVNLMRELILNKLRKSSLYKKVSVLKVRRAKKGEMIITKLKSKKTETINVAKKGDWVIENPTGEEYILNEEEFKLKVRKERKIFLSKGYCKAINNVFNKRIMINAPWGFVQYGNKDCIIAISTDKKGKIIGKPYLIDKKIFIKTYNKIT